MRKIKVPHDPTCHLTQVVSLKISRLALNTRLLYPRHRIYSLAYVTDTQPYTSYLRLDNSIIRHNTVIYNF